MGKSGVYRAKGHSERRNEHIVSFQILYIRLNCISQGQAFNSPQNRCQSKAIVQSTAQRCKGKQAKCQGLRYDKRPRHVL